MVVGPTDNARSQCDPRWRRAIAPPRSAYVVGADRRCELCVAAHDEVSKEKRAAQLRPANEASILASRRAVARRCVSRSRVERSQGDDRIGFVQARMKVAPSPFPRRRTRRDLAERRIARRSEHPFRGKDCPRDRACSSRWIRGNPMQRYVMIDRIVRDSGSDSDPPFVILRNRSIRDRRRDAAALLRVAKVGRNVRTINSFGKVGRKRLHNATLPPPSSFATFQSTHLLSPILSVHLPHPSQARARARARFLVVLLPHSFSRFLSALRSD